MQEAAGVRDIAVYASQPHATAGPDECEVLRVRAQEE